MKGPDRGERQEGGGRLMQIGTPIRNRHYHPHILYSQIYFSEFENINLGG